MVPEKIAIFNFFSWPFKIWRISGTATEPAKAKSITP
jgi:hypothetical protein